MIGAKYTRFKETLDREDLNKTSAPIESFCPDYGLLYSLKKGWRTYFFTFRTYVPLYPWPTKGSDVSFLEGNINNIALEFGAGIKIR